MRLIDPGFARAFAWTMAQKEALVSFYDRRARRPINFILRVALGIVKSYKNRIWDRFAKRDGSISPKRAGWTIFATLFAIWMIPSVMLFSWQVALMATTIQHDVVHLTDSKEIDPLDEIHSIKGCRAIPCRESDAVYYRAQSTLLHDLYSLIKFGHRYFPEDVAGVVAPGVNRCEVISYGIRVKALMRGWGVYPHLLNAVCTPWTETSQPATAEGKVETKAATGKAATAPAVAPEASK